MEGLALTGISKAFGRVRVLADVTLCAAPGRITSLIGPNGAGKSTLFKIIMGLLRADAGEARVDGQPVLPLPLHEKHRVGLGYLPQECASFDELSVEDNLLAILEILPLDKQERRPRLEELLETTGLTAVRSRRFEVLSGGEQRRLEIAKALAGRPRYLLLDEPFSGLDPRICGDLGTLLLALRDRGLGLLITDHNVHATLPLADQVFLLNAGTVIANGPPAEIVNNEQARDFYLGTKFSL